MTSRYVTHLAFVASTIALVACSSAPIPPVANSPTPTASPSASDRGAVPISRADSTRAAVRVWLTTGDQQSLLSRQADVYLVTDLSARDTSIAIIDVDDARTY